MHEIPFYLHPLKKKCKSTQKMDDKREKFMIEAASLEDEREMRKGDDGVTYL